MCQALNVPPALKYESDGGPGIEQIMELLLGSIYSLEDRRTFMTQVFLFWIMGAIDGHAKNFSLALRPGGEFQLTDVYDVMSAYPLIAKKQLEQRRMSMAMSLRGKNRQYQWERMFRRHWLSTAKRCKFPEDEMTQIIKKILGEMDNVIEIVRKKLPENFPGDVATPIFDGMKKARDRMD
jgi:serine/threonine-protein kinase HipA